MNHPQKYASSVMSALFLLPGLAFSPADANAQLLEVKQTVFGMDCAPCAYGLEKRLMHIEGVIKARVSLDDGVASTDLVRESPVKLSAIREAIRESGFSAEHAVVRAEGNLKRVDGIWILELPSGEHFVVEQTLASDRAAEPLQAGRVAITGRVAKGEPNERGGYRLELIAVSVS